MKADTAELNKLFTKDIRYVVPTFQRPYVWTQEEQWEPLWTDFRQVVEDLLESRSDTDVGSQHRLGRDPAPHFLGALVLEQLPTPTSKLEARRVIDGQQRLMTLQVLLAALRAVAQDEGLERQRSLTEKLIFNDKDLIDREAERIKVKPIKPDRKAFGEIITGTSAEGRSNGSTHALYDCFDFFYDSISDWIHEGPEDSEFRVEALVDTLWSFIQLVIIDLEERDDPQVIFETLNARGTPLLAADLVKNYIFREAEKEGHTTDTLHKRYWQEFDEAVWREEVSQGRLERPRIDVFMMHWITMRSARQVRAQQLFPAFRNYLSRRRVGVKEVLEDIAKYSNIYLRFTADWPDTREGRFFDRLDVLDTTTPYPVLLWMYGESPATEEHRIKALEAVESWLIRRMLCRLTTKNYNKIFLDLLERLKTQGSERPDEVVIAFLREKEGTSDIWPEDDDLRTAMQTEPYWGRINQRRLRMVFRALERSLRSSGYSESVSVFDDLEIEHILPRDWGLNWDLPGEEPEEVERIRRDELKHTVGNLTVLTDELNPSLSNAEWKKKREALDDHTVLLLNRELLKRWYDHWGEETIKERAERLADIARSVWPGPNDDYWG